MNLYSFRKTQKERKSSTCIFLKLGALAFISSKVDAAATVPVLVTNPNWTTKTSTTTTTQYLSTSGYRLSSVKTWNRSKWTTYLCATQLTFTQSGFTNQVLTYGDITCNNSSNTSTTMTITGNVISVTNCGNNPSYGFQFNLDSGTSVYTKNANSSTCSASYSSKTMVLCGNFIGFMYMWRKGDKSTYGTNFVQSYYDKGDVTLSISPKIADQTYNLKSTAITTTSWGLTGTYNQAGCLPAVTYTYSYQLSGSTASSTPPFWLINNTVNKTFIISQITDLSLLGQVYTVTITGTLIRSGMSNVVTSDPFLITITSDCLSTVISKPTISNMTAIIGVSATQAVTFTDTISTSRSNSLWCGTQTYTLSPAKTWLTYSGTTLTVLTNTVADVGTYSMSLTVGLASFSTIIPVTKTFTVTISCAIQSIIFNPTPPSTITINVGLTVQPITAQFAITQTPACNTATTFSLSPTPPSWLSITGITTLGGTLQITGTTSANINTYSYTLTASVGGKTVTFIFKVVIQNVCQDTTQTHSFDATNPVKSMSAWGPQTGTILQYVDILLNLSPSNKQVQCPNTATISPAAAYISFSPTFNTITIDQSKIIPSNIGTFSFTLIVSSGLYPSTVPSKSYPFTVTIWCAITSVSFTSPPQDVSATPCGSVLTTNILSAASVYDCGLPFTYAMVSVTKSGTTISKPSWLTFNSNYSYTIQGTKVADQGAYVITSSASLNSISQTTGLSWSVQTSFEVSVQNPCLGTYIYSVTVADYSYIVDSGLSPAYNFQTTQLNSCCGQIFSATYTINSVTSSSSSFFTIDGTAQTLQINQGTVTDSNVGVYTIIYTGTLTLSQSPALTVSDTTTVTIIHSCYGTTISSQTLQNMVVVVGGQTVNQSVVASDSVSAAKGTNYCGPYTITLISEYTFLSISGNTIVLSTADILDYGVYPDGEILISLQNYPDVDGLDILFQVTVICYTSLILITNPIAVTYNYIIDPITLTQTTLSLPTYDTVPSGGCGYGPLSYQLFLTSTGTFPTWITQNPTTNIQFGTTDNTQVGTYTFKLVSTDTLSDYTESSVTFTVILQLMKATIITNATKPPNQTYLIGSTALTVSLPTYTWIPSQATTIFTYTLVSPPVFVTITGSPQTIQIYTTTYSYTGSYIISIQTTDTLTSLTNTVTFTLLVTCVTGIAPSTSPMTSVTYYIADTQIQSTIPSYNLTPSGCPNQLIYQATMSDGTVLPSQFTYTSISTTKKLNVYTINTNLVGVYILKVSVLDPKSGIQNSAQTLQITIKCTKSITLVNNPLNSSIIYTINAATLTQTSLSLPTYTTAISTNCPVGPLTYQLSLTSTGSFPSWLPVNPTVNILIGTTDPSQEGSYSFQFISSDPISSLSNNQVFFTVIMQIIKATSITNLSKPSSQIYLIGSSPLLVNLPTYTYLATGSAINFIYDLVSQPSFVAINSSTKQIQISTSTHSNTGSYTISIQATETYSGLTDTQTFNLLVTCVTAIAPSSQMQSIIYYVGDAQISKLIPAYSLTPSGCPNELVYQLTMLDGSALTSDIRFILNAGAYSINIYSMDASLIGVKIIKVSVTDPKTGISNSAQTFQVIIICTKTVLNLNNSIPVEIDYTIDPFSLQWATLTVPTYGPSPNFCLFGPITYQLQLTSGLGNFPSWITPQNPTIEFKFGTTDNSLKGSYNFKISATDSVSGQSNNSVTFKVNLKLMIATSIITDFQPLDQRYEIGDNPLFVDLPTYTWVLPQSTTSFTQTLVNPPSFITMTGMFMQIKIVTSMWSDTGAFKINILTTETYSGLTDTITFNVYVTCLSAIEPTSTPMQPIIYYITDSQVSQLIPAYIFTPSFCPTQPIYSVTMQDGSAPPSQFSFTATQGAEAINVYTMDPSLEGDYTLYIGVRDPATGVSDESQSLQVKIICGKSISVVNQQIPSQIDYFIDPIDGPLASSFSLPTYGSLPLGCIVGPFSYELLFMGQGDYPTWISDPNGGDISFATNDNSQVGTYTFKLIATDAETGYKDDTVTFKIVLKLLKANSITYAAKLSDQIYLIDSDPLIVDAPAYSWNLPQATTSFTFTLVSPPSFVTINSSTMQIQISTSTYSDTGSYTISIQATETYSGLTDTQTFNLLVTCVTAITPSNQMQSIIYYVGDAQISKLIPAYSLTPSGCPNELTYEVTMSDGSIPPSQFTFTETSSTPEINVFTTILTLTGVYNLKVSVTDPKTGTLDSNQTLKVTILCTKSIKLVTNLIPSQTNYVIDPLSLSAITLTLPTYDSTPTGCAVGPFSYNLILTSAGSFPSWISQNPTNSVQIATKDNTMVGTYTFQLAATDFISGLTNNSVNFTVVLKLMKAISITNATTPPDQIYLVGSNQLSVNLPTYIWNLPQATTSFTFILVSPPSFVKLDGQSQVIQIQTNDYSQTGIYAIEVLASENLSGLIDTKIFQLLVQCVQSIQRGNIMNPIIYQIGDPKISTLIPLYAIYPASCPYELTYSATLQDGSSFPQQFSLDQTNGKQGINVYETDLSKTGVFIILISVTDPKTALKNSDVLFKVTILCTKQISLVANPIPSPITYTINKKQKIDMNFQLPTYQPSPAGCDVGTYFYELILLIPQADFPQLFISQNPSNQITLGTSDVSFIGLYTFQVIATDSLTNLQNSDVSFVVEVTIAQDLSIISSTAIPDQVYRIGDPEVLLNVPHYLHTPPKATVQFEYSLNKNTPSFVSLIGSLDPSSQVQIVSSNYLDTGNYQITVITEEIYSQKIGSQTFNLLVTCVHAITSQSTIIDQIYYISDPQILIHVPSYVLTPNQCPVDLNYKVQLSDGSQLPDCINLDDSTAGEEKINIYETSPTKQAVYKVQILAIDKKTGVQSNSLTFQVTVRLRAIQISIISGTGIQDLTYLVGSQVVQLDLAQYSLFPQNAAYNFHYELDPSTPQFCTIVAQANGYPKAAIYTNNAADTGIYTISVVLTEVYSKLTDTQKFVLTVSCVKSISMQNSLQPVVYYITDPEIAIKIPLYTVTPSDCPYELLIDTVQLTDGSDLPNSLTFDGLNTITLFTNTYTATGSYSINVKALDPKSLITNSSLNFSVIVKCTKRIDVLSKNLSDVIGFTVDYKHLNTLTQIQPTYQPFPTQCVVGTYSYQLANSSSNPITFPGFITAFDNSSLTIATTNVSFYGTYNYEIVVSEQISGLSNSQVAFQIIISDKIYLKQMTVIQTTLINDQNYLIGSQKLLILTPQYVFSPTNSVLNVVWSLENPPSFVNLVKLVNNYWISIETLLTSDTGVYQVDVKTLDEESGLYDIQSFKLIVSCVQSIAPASTLADVLYYVTDPAILIAPKYNLTPTSCPNELTYQVTLQDGSPLPSSIQFDNTQGSQTISVLEKNFASTNAYKVKLVVTDPKTGVQNSNVSFGVTILCTKSIDITTNAIQDFIYQICLSQPLELNIPVPQFQPNPPQCAVGTYSFKVIQNDSTQFPSFITQVPTDFINLATQDVKLVGVYHFQIVATESISRLSNDQDTFTATIVNPNYTTSMSIISQSAIKDLTYLVGSSVVYLNAPQYTVTPQNADKQLQYSLDSTKPNFVTLISQPSGMPLIKILTSDPSDTGVYQINVILTENFTGLSKQSNFILTVSCVQKIAQNNIITPILYFIGDQPQQVNIPQYSLFPQACPNELIYTATLLNGFQLINAITLFNQGVSHQLQISETDPKLTGFYTILITVQDPKTLLTNSDLQVQVTLKCTKSIVLVSNQIINLRHRLITDPAQTGTYPVPVYDVNPSFCLKLDMQLIVYYKGIPQAPFPTFVTQNPTTTVVLHADDSMALGAYNFYILATEPLSGLTNSDVKFTVAITNTEYATSINLVESSKLTDQIYHIGDLATLILAPSYTYQPNYVKVNFSYSFVLPYSFLSIVTDPIQGQKIRIQSSNPLDFGIYQIKVIVTEDYSGLTNVSTLNLLITCVNQIVPTGKISDVTYYISDPQQLVVLPTFGLVPKLCPNQLIYSIKMADNTNLPQSITLSTIKGQEQVKIKDTSPLGTGIFEIKIVVTDPTTKVTGSITFKVIIKCTKSIQLINNPITPVTYNVGTQTLVETYLQIPQYSPFPANCIVGAYTFLLSYIDMPSAQLPSFISQNPTNLIKIATQDVALLGTYNFKITTTDSISGLKNFDATFNVNLVCQVQGLDVSTVNFSSQINYNIGSQNPLYVSLPTYSILPARCQSQYNLSIVENSTTSVRRLISSGKNPSWISISSDQKQLSIESSDYSLLGSHRFQIVATVPAFNVINQDIVFNLKVDCIVSGVNLIAAQWQTKYTYHIIPTIENNAIVPLPEFSTFPYSCVKEYTYLVINTGNNQAISQFINLDNTQKIMRISSQDINYMGSYTLQLIAQEPFGKAKSLPIYFTLLLDCQVTQVYQSKNSNLALNFKYIIGETSQRVQIPIYLVSPSGCKKPLKYSLFNTLINSIAPTQTDILPQFVNFDPTSGRIILFGTNMKEGQKFYTFILQAVEPISGLKDLSPFQFTVQVDIFDPAPYFQTPPQDVTIYTDKSDPVTDAWKLPRIVSNNIVSVLTSMGNAVKFLSFDTTINTYTVNRKFLNPQLVGSYKISIVLTDVYGVSQKSSFIVNIDQRNKEVQILIPQLKNNSTQNIISNYANSTQPTKQDFINENAPSILSNQILQSTNSTEIQQNNQNLSLDPSGINQAATQINQPIKTTPLMGIIGQVDLTGYFDVTWSDDIYPLNLISLIQKNAVQVKVIWMNEDILTEKKSKPEYQSQIIEVTETHIRFRLLFQDIDLISQGTQPDIVLVNFANLDFFIRQSDGRPLSSTSQILMQQIPRQVDIKQSPKVKKAQTTVKSLTGLTTSTMAVSSLMSLPAASFWGCFNTVQLISMESLHGAQMPANAANFFKTVNQMLQGGPLNPNKLIEKYFSNTNVKSIPILKRQLQNTNQLSNDQQIQQMAQTTFQQKNPFIEAGFFIMLIFISTIASIFLTIMGATLNRCGNCGVLVQKHLVKRLKKVFMFDMLIRAQLFGYVYFLLTGVKKSVFQKNLLELGSTQQATNSFLYYFMFAYVMIYPINVFLFLLFSGTKGLQNKTILKYFGALYDGLDVTSLLKAQTTTLFLVRRFIIGVSIAFLRDYYFMQLEILLISSLFCLCFTVLTMPYKSRLNNIVEVFNETMVITTVYIMHGFSYFIPSSAIRYKVGWVYIYIVVAVFLANFAVIIQKVLFVIVSAIKSYRAKKKAHQKLNLVQKLFYSKNSANILKKKKKKRFVKNNKVIDATNAAVEANLVKKKNKDLSIIAEDPQQEETEYQNYNDDVFLTPNDNYQRGFNMEDNEGRNDGFGVGQYPNLGETRVSAEEIRNYSVDNESFPRVQQTPTRDFLTALPTDGKVTPIILSDQCRSLSIENYGTDQKLMNTNIFRTTEKTDYDDQLFQDEENQMQPSLKVINNKKDLTKQPEKNRIDWDNLGSSSKKVLAQNQTLNNDETPNFKISLPLPQNLRNQANELFSEDSAHFSERLQMLEDELKTPAYAKELEQLESDKNGSFSDVVGIGLMKKTNKLNNKNQQDEIQQKVKSLDTNIISCPQKQKEAVQAQHRSIDKKELSLVENDRQAFQEPNISLMFQPDSCIDETSFYDNPKRSSPILSKAQMRNFGAKLGEINVTPNSKAKNNPQNSRKNVVERGPPSNTPYNSNLKGELDLFDMELHAMHQEYVANPELSQFEPSDNDIFDSVLIEQEFQANIMIEQNEKDIDAELEMYNVDRRFSQMGGAQANLPGKNKNSLTQMTNQTRVIDFDNSTHKSRTLGPLQNHIYHSNHSLEPSNDHSQNQNTRLDNMTLSIQNASNLQRMTTIPDNISQKQTKKIERIQKYKLDLDQIDEESKY